MSITERQNKILDAIIGEYIRSAQPVSSQLLEKRHNFGIRSASIRLEMQKLTDEGYLFQPHTSAGRVPTDKGYRFFVDKLLKRGLKDLEEIEFLDLSLEDIEDSVELIHSLTRNLALATDALVLSYLERKNILWTEGWEEVLREPEFSQKDYIRKFTEFLESFENKICDLKLNSEIKVYIGREMPFKKASDFSIIVSRCQLRECGEESIVSLLGPKRMPYKRNIGLMNSLLRLLKKF
jgi:transcriptional regulator of heat shock response